MVRDKIKFKELKKSTRLTATHSLTSQYLGRETIVLKLPLTKAALTKGLQRYKALPEGAEGVMAREGWLRERALRELGRL